MPAPDLRPVRISPTTSSLPAEAAGLARELAGSPVARVLSWADGLSRRVPLPAGGWTAERWEVLASLGAHDLTVARVLEPHLDATAILAEAGDAVPDGTRWGVWAAEGPDARLRARQDGAGDWLLSGRKAWCSLAGTVSHALVTAWVDDERRGLFAVALDAPGIAIEEGSWVPAGLADVTTVPVGFDEVPARPVGEPGWYLARDGFWWGGIGVAAVWYGGAVGLARRLAAQLRSREPDQVGLMHLGAVDVALTGARAALAGAAAVVDAGTARGPAALLLAARVRHVVATAVEEVDRHVAHALGPGPLSQEREHVARVADLGLFVRQHHAERDSAGLGALLLEHHPGATPW